MLYCDLIVEVTNMYNECDLDYYMQAFAPIFTSFAGILAFSISLLNVVISADTVYVYEGMSAAAYNVDEGNAGKYLGLWTKHLIGVEL